MLTNRVTMKYALILCLLTLGLTASAQTPAKYRVYTKVDKPYYDSLGRGILAIDLPGYLAPESFVTKTSWKAVATYTELLTVAPIPSTVIQIFVNADEKRGGGYTIYNLLPNGDRWLTGFLTVKDN